LAQARKKSNKVAISHSQLAKRLRESIFLLLTIAAVYLFACLSSYDPGDPGPFNTVASDHVQNIGRVLGAWMANFFLFLTGYIAYSLPLLMIYAGWVVYTERKETVEGSVTVWMARITGLVLFVLAATGLAQMHAHPPAGEMPAGGGGVVGMQIAGPLTEMTGALGATLSLLALLLVGITLFTGLSWFHVMDLIGKVTLGSIEWVGKSIGRTWRGTQGRYSAPEAETQAQDRTATGAT
jgi:S-DNA-T family DNA segregation ATPase FtsK/SpoIIIE